MVHSDRGGAVMDEILTKYDDITAVESHGVRLDSLAKRAPVLGW